MTIPNHPLLRATARGLAALAGLAAVTAQAATLKVTVENLAPDDGLWFTPVFFGFHDGSFDLFDPGVLAASDIEAVAEGGDVSGLVSRLSATPGSQSHVLLGKDSASGPPAALFAPSNIDGFSSANSFLVHLDPTLNRYLSFASMIVPSNDAFIGNANPAAYDLFNIAGAFNEGFQIDLFGSDIWDSGTEANDGLGAAFSTLGGTSTDTLLPVAQHTGLDRFVGNALPVGGVLETAFDDATPVARISVERVPDSTQYIGAMGALALFGFRLVAKRRMGKRAD